MKGREYTFRKWHSLMGVIPVGVFLTQHLIVNNFATRGAEAFNKAAGFMELLPFRYALEIFIIFLPILYHAIYGLYIAFTAKNNAVSYGYFRNWMFVFQRISGIVTLIFISWHVWETRIQAMLGKEVNYDMMADILNNPAMFTFYLVGVVSTIFHFANGLWTFCISWGITVSPRSQRISTYVTLAIFLGLSYVGVSALLAFIDPQLANQ
ncbi:MULTISPECIES: succinate dehydrogenase cytochrome B558 [Bacillales]|uniref:Succinate dehydrogenase cytochrome b558 subunit n=3 Tax=Bacillus cereus group TaxID=86661 RepID=A0A9W5R386_BACCE|nr:MULTISPECIES: succinate dehydrogenase cytochrome B558 [Bacillales]MCO4215691.1 succinate dehydrogenase cytochrome B558 [Bacillus sp. 10017]MCX2700343.1 succinate dehydrogenase cytochrome B558 [Bacillus sp. AS_5]MEB4839282.1 succinate dehydrogenase cytochrome B558 [Paenibacillus jamilae]HCF31308.1 succinate dehydrogenase [Bacillus sp. (in: firmicutes)]AKE18806.1 Succinate dehydrogenase cytochrome b558 subunit [Bacillus cereus]